MSAKIIDLERLSRFLDHVKTLISGKASKNLSDVPSSDFAAKVTATQADTIYTATSDDGVTYTATIPGITELYAGLRITLKLSRTSASTGPKLNINGLGAKNIRQPLGSNNVATTTGSTNTWLSSGGPLTLIYTGTLWKTEHQRSSAATLYGTTKIENGGTGADNAADALENLGAASLEYVKSEIARLEELINS